MMKIGTVFKFIAPNGWSQFQEGNRYVLHGPNREELIVSASLIQGIGTTGDLAAVQQRLFQNAEQSARNAAAHPALKVTQPFQQNASVLKIECWTLLAQTQEGETLFYQAVYRDPRGVLLATLEAPNTATTTNVFEQFVKSVEVVSESEALVE
jgi:hypothetical protein